VQTFEHKLTIDDEIRDFEARVIAISEDEGLAIVRDITARTRAEEALRHSEERYRELVEDINDVIYEVDTSGRVTYISPMAEEVSGYSPNEIIGRTFAEFIPPKEVPARMDTFREGLKGRPIPTEFSLVSKSGEILWIHTSPRVIREGDRVTGYRGVMTDITANKRAEDALRESEQRYRALYDDNPTMYFTVDTEGTVLSVNRFGAEQLGYKADELVGRPVLGIFHAEDREAVQEQLAACVRNPAEVAQWEFRKVRKDGSLLWVKETVRAVRGPDGDTIVLIVCEDITERKRAEEALQEAREELESKVETQLQRGSTYGLTFRELTVIHLVATGKSDKEIGALLSISPRTANKHVQNILTKMGASSRTEAGVRAVREGLVD
jgi:PAS domain S-box-containing protein